MNFGMTREKKANHSLERHKHEWCFIELFAGIAIANLAVITSRRGNFTHTFFFCFTCLFIFFFIWVTLRSFLHEQIQYVGTLNYNSLYFEVKIALAIMVDLIPRFKKNIYRIGIWETQGNIQYIFFVHLLMVKMF